jgi:hypothetical protein
MQSSGDYHSQQSYIRGNVRDVLSEPFGDRTQQGSFPGSSPQPKTDQLNMLPYDLEKMRSAMHLLQSDRDQLYRNYIESLSRWKTREARMKNIIDKQRRMIKKMQSQLGPGTTRNTYDPVSYQSPISSESSSSAHVDDLSPYSVPLERSFVPPWDIDMDDIRRQLHDIDESICRVEQARTGLCGRDVPRRISLSQDLPLGGLRVASDKKRE